MSDWQVGDLALCVKRGAWANAASKRPTTGPSYGETCRVRAIGAGYRLAEVLWFDGWPGDTLSSSFQADRFRKIRPDAHEACEEEFVTLLRRKRVRA